MRSASLKVYNFWPVFKVWSIKLVWWVSRLALKKTFIALLSLKYVFRVSLKFWSTLQIIYFGVPVSYASGIDISWRRYSLYPVPLLLYVLHCLQKPYSVINLGRGLLWMKQCLNLIFSSQKNTIIRRSVFQEDDSEGFICFCWS